MYRTVLVEIRSYGQSASRTTLSMAWFSARDIGNEVAYPVAAGYFSEVAKHCGCHSPEVVLVRHCYCHVADFRVVGAHVVRHADQPARLKRADRIVGWTVFDQLAGKPMQKARVNDKESVVAVAIGEVGMKRFHRFCVVCIETAQ